MRIRCKICKKFLESEDLSRGGMILEIDSDTEFGVKLAEMSKHMLVLIQHLFAEHPEEAFEIYSDISSRLNDLFEVSDEEDFSL